MPTSTCILKLIRQLPNTVMDLVFGPQEQIAYVTVTCAEAPGHDPDQPLLREGPLGAGPRRAGVRRGSLTSRGCTGSPRGEPVAVPPSPCW